VSREIPTDAKTPGVVARHMIRSPITPERMLGEASSAQIIYRSDIVHPRHPANFRLVLCEILAEGCQMMFLKGTPPRETMNNVVTQFNSAVSKG
jgi:hypothetical protein